MAITTRLGNLNGSKLNAKHTQLVHDDMQTQAQLMWAQYTWDVFRPKFDDSADVSYDFQDIQDMFCLKELDLNIVRLWCM